VLVRVAEVAQGVHGAAGRDERRSARLGSTWKQLRLSGPMLAAGDIINVLKQCCDPPAARGHKLWQPRWLSVDTAIAGPGRPSDHYRGAHGFIQLTDPWGSGGAT
jgi:hypothetical protein